MRIYVNFAKLSNLSYHDVAKCLCIDEILYHDNIISYITIIVASLECASPGNQSNSFCGSLFTVPTRFEWCYM